MRRYVLFSSIVLVGMFFGTMDVMARSNSFCGPRQDTGDNTLDLSDEYLYLNRTGYNEGGPVFECGDGNKELDHCWNNAYVYINGYEQPYIGNKAQTKKFFQCSTGWDDRWIATDMSNIRECPEIPTSNSKYLFVGEFNKENNIYVNNGHINKGSVLGADWYSGDLEDFCFYSSKVIRYVNQDAHKYYGKLEDESSNGNKTGNNVNDGKVLNNKDNSVVGQGETANNASGTSNAVVEDVTNQVSGPCTDDSCRNAENKKVTEEKVEEAKREQESKKKEEETTTRILCKNLKNPSAERKACCDAGVLTKWTGDERNGTCTCYDQDTKWDGKRCVALKAEITNGRCFFGFNATVDCGGYGVNMNGALINNTDLQGLTCEEFNDRFYSNMSMIQAIVKSYGLCNSYAQQQSKQEDAEEQLKKKERLTKAKSNLDAFFSKVNSDKSVWKNADGSFNGVRLASDLTAGVVLGTVGGVVSGVLIKKSQVEKGFDALNCTINGQKVADWGDEFSVGLRR